MFVCHTTGLKENGNYIMQRKESINMRLCIVEPVLSGHSKIDKTKILITNTCMLNEGQKYCRICIANSAILLTCIKQYVSFKPIFCLF